MQTKPKSNSIVTTRQSDEMFDVTIRVPKTLYFAVEAVGETELDLESVSASNMSRACVHGWFQRVPDGAAISATDKDGNIIPKVERSRIKFERMGELCVHYESGTEEWSRVSSGGGGGKSLTVEAIARVYACSYDEAVAKVEAHATAKYAGDVKVALAKLRGSAKVQAAMLEIKTERMPAAKVDVQAELDELMNEPSA